MQRALQYMFLSICLDNNYFSSPAAFVFEIFNTDEHIADYLFLFIIDLKNKFYDILVNAKWRR